MKSEMTLFARGLKCGCFMGFVSVVHSLASSRSWLSRDTRPSPLIPPHVSKRKSRLDRNCFKGLPQIYKLVQIQQHVREAGQIVLLQVFESRRALLIVRTSAERQLVRQFNL